MLCYKVKAKIISSKNCFCDCNQFPKLLHLVCRITVLWSYKVLFLNLIIYWVLIDTSISNYGSFKTLAHNYNSSIPQQRKVIKQISGIQNINPNQPYWLYKLGRVGLNQNDDSKWYQHLPFLTSSMLILIRWRFRFRLYEEISIKTAKLV